MTIWPPRPQKSSTSLLTTATYPEEHVEELTSDVAGVREAFIRQLPLIRRGSARSGNIEARLKGGDLETIQQLSKTLEPILEKVEGVQFVNPSFELGMPELVVNVDRVRASELGLTLSEVGSVVDTLVYVASPGSGDQLQFMKAGLIEEPDLFVVNKADLGPEATRTAGELEGGIGLSERRDAGWTPPLLLISALRGEGTESLVDALDAHRRHLEADARLRERRRRGAARYVLAALERRYGSFGLGQLGGRESLETRLASGAQTQTFACIAALGAEIEAALRR